MSVTCNMTGLTHQVGEERKVSPILILLMDCSIGLTGIPNGNGLRSSSFV